MGNRTPPPLTFRRTHRLQHALEFQGVYDARVNRSGGPIVLYSRPNQQPTPRLGLSVGKRVGNAVDRNRVKRLLREAFRLAQHDLPAHASETGQKPHRYDYVIVARPHRPLHVDRYREILTQLAIATHKEWERRGPRTTERANDAL